MAESLVDPFHLVLVRHRRVDLLYGASVRTRRTKAIPTGITALSSGKSNGITLDSRPLGSLEFVARLVAQIGRMLRHNKPGPKGRSSER
jgi:hypothetical protein